jgi:hypothetical protein
MVDPPLLDASTVEVNVVLEGNRGSGDTWMV